MKRIVFVGVLIAAALASWWGFRASRSPGARVQTVTVVRADVVDQVRVMGRVEAVQSETVRARKRFLIDEVLVEEGDFVKQGHALLQIDRTEGEDAVKRARLKVEEAEISVTEAANRLGASERLHADPREIETFLTGKRAEREQALIERDAARRELDVAHQLYEVASESLLGLRAKEDRLRTAEVRLALADQELQEARTGFEKKEQTRINLSELRGEHELSLRRKSLAEAELELSLAQVKRLHVVSPITGTVTDVAVERGMVAVPGQALVDVADLDELQVRAEVDELDAGRVREGQDVVVRFDAFPGWSITGRVASVGAQAELRNGRAVLDTSISLNEPSELLKIGNQVDVRIVLSRRDGVPVVPLGTVRGNHDPFVWVERDGVVQQVTVETGLSDLEQVEIVAGLGEGDRVVVGSVKSLAEGDQVRVVPVK